MAKPSSKSPGGLGGFARKRYREIGLALIALIYTWAYLTAKDPFWAGRATFFGMLVLFPVALFEVMKDGVEKS